MLLCDEGSEERVRLDMLAQISVDRIVPAYDVIRRKDGVPEQYHAANIGFYATGSATGNRIIAMSEDAAYWLETTDSKGGGEFLDVESYHELKSAMFLAATDDHIVNFVSVPYKGLYKPEHDAVICVSREGNVYAWNTVEVETGFEYPINTSVRGGTPEYKVAPYVGTMVSPCCLIRIIIVLFTGVVKVLQVAMSLEKSRCCIRWKIRRIKILVTIREIWIWCVCLTPLFPKEWCIALCRKMASGIFMR